MMDQSFAVRSELATENGATMKRIIYMWMAASVLVSFAIAQTPSTPTATTQTTQTAGAQETTISNSVPQEPSLGSYARAVRKDKKQEAAKHFDNDNLPRQDKLSVVGNPSADEASAAPLDETQQMGVARAATDTPKMTPGLSADDRQKVIDQWQQKLDQQHSQIDSLSRALELDQREYRVHAAEYYNDPSQRVGTTGQWGKDDADYKKKIADEQKAISDAKQKFEDLEEEARHSGVPNSVREAAQEQPESAPPSQPEAAPEETAPQQ